MRKYETLLLFSPEMGAEELAPVIENYKGVIERQGGQGVVVDDWGVKELAYPVRKFLRGHYIRLEYLAPANAIAELERIIRITDGMMKFVTVKLDEDVEEKIDQPQEAAA